jgi:hypothetical protein
VAHRAEEYLAGSTKASAADPLTKAKTEGSELAPDAVRG